MPENWPGQAAYERHKAELTQMHADYDAMDQAELVEFMAALDERDRDRGAR